MPPTFLNTKEAPRNFLKIIQKKPLIFHKEYAIIIFVVNGGIAQLVRAHAWHAWGHWFDPNCLHQTKRRLGRFFCLAGQNGENQRKIVKTEKENRYVKQNAKARKFDKRSAFVAMRQERSQLSVPTKKPICYKTTGLFSLSKALPWFFCFNML